MIRVYEAPAAVTFDIEGPATMMESPAVHATAIDHLSRGVRYLRFDLRACTTMDSTFLGTLLSLERQLEKVDGNLVLVSPSTRVRELLAEMGIDDFYAIEVADRSTGPSTLVSPDRPGPTVLQRRIVDAHEELARGPGSAARQFGPVVEELHRDPGAPPSKDESRPSSPTCN